MIYGKVLIGKGKRGNREEYAYLTTKDGALRPFASKAEMRRAAFQQFGDDLNVVEEEISNGPDGETQKDSGLEPLGEGKAPSDGSTPSENPKAGVPTPPAKRRKERHHPASA